MDKVVRILFLFGPASKLSSYHGLFNGLNSFASFVLGLILRGVTQHRGVFIKLFAQGNALTYGGLTYAEHLGGILKAPSRIVVRSRHSVCLLLEGVNLTLEPVLLLPGHVLPLEVFSQFKEAKSEGIKLLKNTDGDGVKLQLLERTKTAASSHKDERSGRPFLGAHNSNGIDKTLCLYTELKVSKVAIIFTKASSLVDIFQKNSIESAARDGNFSCHIFILSVF